MDTLYRKQCLLAREPADGPGVQSLRLPGGLCLSWEQGLRVQAIDGPRGLCVLLGYAIQCQPGACDPEEALAREDATPLGELVRTWGGRWGLIAEGCLYTDVSGLFGLYYTDGGATGPVVSTSVAWLRARCDAPLRADYQPVKYGESFDFFPGPSTPWVGVRKLMNTQLLRLDGETLRAEPTLALRRRDEDRETLLALLNESLCATCATARACSPRLTWR